jgi:hypothetical protein
MIQNNTALESELIMLSLCGSLAELGFTNQWNLQRKFNELQAEFEKTQEALEETKTPSNFIPSLRTDLTKLFVLANVANCSSCAKVATNKAKYVTEQKALALTIAKTLVQEKYAGLFSGINNFDNIWWFNKEMTDESLALWATFALHFATAKQVPEVLKLYKLLCDAKLKAAYKCQLFVQAFEEEKKVVAKKKKK